MSRITPYKWNSLRPSVRNKNRFEVKYFSRLNWRTLNLDFFSVFSRILSARCPSVLATTFHGVDRLGRFMGRSIAYGLRTLTKEGIFFRPVLDLMGGVWSPISFVFRMKIGFWWYLRRTMSLLLDRKRRGSPGGSLIPSDRLTPQWWLYYFFFSARKIFKF